MNTLDQKQTEPAARPVPAKSQDVSRSDQFVATQTADGMYGDTFNKMRQLTKSAAPTLRIANDDTGAIEIELLSYDAIAREALEEARRVEEAKRYRNNPGAIVAPPGAYAPRW